MDFMFLLFSCCLAGWVLDTSNGQYSSQPEPYAVAPVRTVSEYKRQIEEDLNVLENKARALAQRECLVGQEAFIFCSLQLNIIEFSLCLKNPNLTEGSDAFSRGVKFPSSAFTAPPVVATFISGMGAIIYGDVTVQPRNVYASGFNIVLTGGQPTYPYSVTIQWIACPARSPLYTSVRDFKPSYDPPPPPYFPLRNSPAPAGSYKYNAIQSSYEESSSPVEYSPTYQPSYGPSQPSYLPSQPSYVPNKPSYIPSQPSYRPNEPAYESSQSTFERSEPNYQPSQPSYVPSLPSYQPSQPSYVPSQPSYQPSQPSYEPSQPSYVPSQPSYQPNQPIYVPSQPSYQPSQPNYVPSQPSYQPNQPSYVPSQPSYVPSQPSYQPSQPGYVPNQPSYQPSQSSYAPR